MRAAGGASTQMTNVTIRASKFTGNLATDRGGAINLQSGSLILESSVFERNAVTAASISDIGTGGAIAIIDACSTGVCAPAIANITNSNFSANHAFQAGGALYFATANAGDKHASF